MRLLDYVYRDIDTVAAGCVAPSEIGLKPDHSLVWAVYEAGKATKQRRI